MWDASTPSFEAEKMDFDDRKNSDSPSSITPGKTTSLSRSKRWMEEELWDHPFLPDHESQIGVIVVKKQQQRNFGVDVPPQGW
ncbi:hypothetical protein NPIL_135011 [Nephila pilipes]|uniref:Uncharacterized protein n=1 Tax=Nephila pilipes TaxID=299642 RepID=A0A8X6P2Z6_NEPPI|nr:hypothetical protein NPIL_135011 [Nephila pilipes]